MNTTLAILFAVPIAALAIIFVKSLYDAVAGKEWS